MNISIAHKNLEWARVEVDGKVIGESDQTTEFEIAVDLTSAARMVVQFRPYKIKPLLRIEGFLIDYWLGGVYQQDHQIEFNLSDDFFDDYRRKDIEGRISYLSESQKNVEHFHDKYVGINNLHPDLLEEIRKLII